MGAGQSRVVLVVDDSSEVREYYQRVLRRAGFRVVLAGEGERALDVVRQIRPDCIVLDMLMPELDGGALLERLRDKGPDAPPVVVTSGFDWPESEALARGARAFLRKPLAASDLLACVRAAIDGRPLPAAERETIVERSSRTRATARAARNALTERIDLADPRLREPLDELVRFVSGWFGFGVCTVHVERSGTLQLVTLTGDPQPVQRFAADERSARFRTQVLDGGSALVVASVEPRGPMGMRFFAGLPVATRGGLVVGALCLIDDQPHTLHAEELGVIDQCAQAVGRRIEALADGTELGRMMVSAPGLVTRHGLHVLLDAELRSARRQRSAVELALIELGSDEPVEPLVDAIYGVTGRRRVAVARYGERVLATLRQGRAPEALGATLDDTLKLLQSRTVLAGAGVVTCEVGDGAVLPAVEVERLADEARARASVTGGAERVVLRREPDTFHADS